MLRAFLLNLQIAISLSTIGCETKSTDEPQPEIRLLEEWTLPSEIPESSGLILLDGILYTHNDSGNETTLYELSTVNGSLLQSNNYQNMNLRDWEAIASDGNSIYLGDIGNNQGSRRDLAIIRFPLTEIESRAPNLSRQQIEYEDQSDFTPANRMTAYDAEAIVYHQDRLLLFTKDWLEFDTTIYDLTNDDLGSYPPVQNLNIEGLVTDASAMNENKIIIVGYDSGLSPFLTILNKTGDSYVIDSRVELDTIFESGAQIEGIAVERVEGNTVTLYLTSEQFQLTIGEESIELPAKLYKLEWQFAE